MSYFYKTLSILWISGLLTITAQASHLEKDRFEEDKSKNSFTVSCKLLSQKDNSLLKSRTSNSTEVISFGNLVHHYLWTIRKSENSLVTPSFAHCLKSELFFAQVKHLRFYKFREWPEENLKLLSSWTQLETLDLYLSNQGNPSVLILTSLTNLTDLNLGKNQITNGDGLSSLTKLTRLNLVDNEVNNIDFISHLTYLTKIELNYNPLNDLSCLKSLTNVEDLDLSHCGVTDEKLKTLFYLTKLIKLDLGWNNITSEGGEELTSLTNLTHLSLYNNLIDSYTVQKWTVLKKLKFVNVLDNLPDVKEMWIPFPINRKVRFVNEKEQELSKFLGWGHSWDKEAISFFMSLNRY